MGNDNLLPTSARFVYYPAKILLTQSSCLEGRARILPLRLDASAVDRNSSLILRNQNTTNLQYAYKSSERHIGTFGVKG